MRPFEIWRNGIEKPVATLAWDVMAREDERWTGGIIPPLGREHAPVPFRLYCDRTGETEVDTTVCRLWVEGRIVPRNRQNLGAILKRMGLTYYDPPSILVSTEGRTDGDEFYVREVDGNDGQGNDDLLAKR